MKRMTLLLFSVLVLSGCWHTGSGQKIGTIIKISKQGLFFKTWEVEIVKGGLNGGSGAFSPTPVYVTVEDTQFLSLAQEAFNNQREIVVTYDHESVCPFRSDTDGNFVTSIRYADAR